MVSLHKRMLKAYEKHGEHTQADVVKKHLTDLQQEYQCPLSKEVYSIIDSMNKH